MSEAFCSSWATLFIGLIPSFKWVNIEHGMSNATFYKWRAKYGGMDASLITRLKELEAENAKLKKMYAEERLKAEIIQEAMSKKW